MKLKQLAFCMSAAAFALTSCNLDNEPSENNSSANFTVHSLIMPKDADSYPVESTYNLVYYPYQQQMTVGCGNLILNNSSISFKTNAMKYTVGGYTNGTTIMEVNKFSGGTYNEDGVSISNLTGYTTQIANIPTLDDQIYKFPFLAPLVMQYDINDQYTVKTFMSDEVYAGQTTLRTQSTGGSTGGSFNDSEMLYRLVFNKKDMTKATLIFYDAKFAERMPVRVNFIVEDLQVRYTKNGYVVSIPEGEQRVPEMYEGTASTTPYPGYVFTSLTLTNSSSDLTSAAINYWIDSVKRQEDGTTIIMDTYNGVFQGSYCSDGSQN